MMLINSISGKILVKNVEEAIKYSHRLKGLLGRKSIDEDYALIIYSCSGVHTWFMRFPIDIILLDKNKRVIKIYTNMQPWKTTKIITGANYVIEAKGNSIASEVKIGHTIQW